MIHGALLISPELVLLLTVVLVLLAEVFSPGRAARGITGLTVFGMLAALALTLMSFGVGTAEVASRTILIDPVSQFFKTLLILAGGLTAMQAHLSKEIERREVVEFQVLMLLGTLSMCMVASAAHLLLLFVSFEAASLSIYLLVAAKRKSPLPSEAALKLFIQGAVTTILFAFGVVILYSLTRTLNILDMRAGLASFQPANSLLWVAFGLIFTAVAARLSIFPFHFLAPDIAQGAAHPVSSFFTVSMHIAALSVFLRLCLHIFSAKATSGWAHLAGFDWHIFVAAVAAITMTIGNLTAINQTNLKRMAGYALSAQMGYVLMGLAVSSEVGITVVLFSLAAYGLLAFGMMFVLQLVTDEAESEQIATLRGLVWKRPYEGVALCIFLLGLAGLPPFAGFVGRFYLMGVVIREKYYWLAIVGGVNWVIGMSYFLSMVRQIFASVPAKERGLEYRPRVILRVLLTTLLIPTFALGIFWDPLMNRVGEFLSKVSW